MCTVLLYISCCSFLLLDIFHCTIAYADLHYYGYCVKSRECILVALLSCYSDNLQNSIGNKLET